jgi:hypothetical protein
MNGKGANPQCSDDLRVELALPSVNITLGLTNRSSGRVRDKVPSSYTGARAAQLNR